MWNEKSYITDKAFRNHNLRCKICNDAIIESYYLNSYGNGILYMTETGDQCHMVDGGKIKCTWNATCSKCGERYSSTGHRLQVWTTIVGKEERFNGSTYTDNLGNDMAKPGIDKTVIEKDIENNQIKITPMSSDRGTKYVYYIESYDVATNALIAISNIN